MSDSSDQGKEFVSSEEMQRRLRLKREILRILERPFSVDLTRKKGITEAREKVANQLLLIIERERRAGIKEEMKVVGKRLDRLPCSYLEGLPPKLSFWRGDILDIIEALKRGEIPEDGKDE